MTASSTVTREPAANLRDVDMRFGDVRALRDISFTVPTGGICGLVGPNGAGKTTTLRILAADLIASGGEVEILGQTLPFAGNNVRRKIGYMPDSAGLYEELSLPEYLDFFAHLYGIPAGQRRAAVDTAVELSGTRGLAGRKLKGLSRGEQQRILLARALIHDPDIFLLDEPAAGLDPRGRVELRELLRLMHERGKTILISSHILSDLQEICTHLVLIDRGRVVFQGTHEELYSGGLQRCRIKIESTKSLTPILEFLGGLEGLVLDEPGPAWVVIDAPADPAVAQDLLQQLVRRDLGIVSFERRTESLEDVYLRLTDFEADNE